MLQPKQPRLAMDLLRHSIKQKVCVSQERQLRLPTINTLDSDHSMWMSWWWLGPSHNCWLRRHIAEYKGPLSYWVRLQYCGIAQSHIDHVWAVPAQETQEPAHQDNHIWDGSLLLTKRPRLSAIRSRKLLTYYQWNPASITQNEAINHRTGALLPYYGGMCNNSMYMYDAG